MICLHLLERRGGEYVQEYESSDERKETRLDVKRGKGDGEALRLSHSLFHAELLVDGRGKLDASVCCERNLRVRAPKNAIVCFGTAHLDHAFRPKRSRNDEEVAMRLVEFIADDLESLEVAFHLHVLLSPRAAPQRVDGLNRSDVQHALCSWCTFFHFLRCAECAHGVRVARRVNEAVSNRHKHVFEAVLVQHPVVISEVLDDEEQLPILRAVEAPLNLEDKLQLVELVLDCAAEFAAEPRCIAAAVHAGH